MSLFQEAKKYIPGGVNSPVRAFGSVGGEPYFVERAKGAHLWDTDGKEYIDYVCSWGPLILGHSDDEVIAEVSKALEKGASFGAPTKAETLLAAKITELFPSVEMVRMVSSGTEAVMSALRLARGFTKRDKIIKFEGCYHGHSDFMLVKAGSGLLTFGETSSPGVPADAAKLTIVAQYNNLNNVKEIFEKNKNEIACVIVEPVAANMGLVLPDEGFLEGLRKLCDENGSLLIFDEVITGFRLAPGGAQEFYGIKPDLTTMGKIIGGGLPVGAYGGRADIMSMVSPQGPVYQAGTLSGNPLAMAAGLKTLERLSAKGFHEKLNEQSAKLWQGFGENLKKLNLNYGFNSVCSLSCLYFAEGPIKSFADAMKADTKKYAKYFHGMLEKGVTLAPAQFEAMFVSAAHSDEDIEKTVKAHYEVLRSM
ncbi:MAG: glutamate-1-semialdehyde 2,1-aminomutase [Deferribacterales bacterium]|nr:glutamate-1-semialdehyde 2,1-aminomutase [Deferribacterales bacterium]